MAGSSLKAEHSQSLDIATGYMLHGVTKNGKSDSASHFPSGVAGGDSVLTDRIGAARAAFLFAGPSVGI